MLFQIKNTGSTTYGGIISVIKEINISLTMNCNIQSHLHQNLLHISYFLGRGFKTTYTEVERRHLYSSAHGIMVTYLMYSGNVSDAGILTTI